MSELTNVIKENQDKLPSGIFKVPLTICITGSTGCGKSTYAKKILREELIPQLDWVILLSTTDQYNHDYDFLPENLDSESDKLKVAKIYKDHDIVIDEVIDSQSDLMLNNKKKDVPQILMLFDDMIGSSSMSRFGSKLDIFSAKSRHLNISMIFISQRISAISRTIRLNSAIFVIFSSFNYSEVESFISQYIPKKFKKKVLDKLNTIFNVKYNYLLANNKNPKINERLLINGVKPLDFNL
jgi:hypothetical protein